ncbi:LamG-like jellyroll fold domain-containing protein [Actinomadura barringtoniae]|uniref:LamG-like jellyroll fold domain-containing protein n=1 Tax=Actinomadura barringtoniae TaxID=1427535 RepID=UPI0027DD10F4|nr:LamG-like jellyroll fold domain-containing protein [Actinomadura barringtoniae]
MQNRRSQAATGLLGLAVLLVALLAQAPAHAAGPGKAPLLITTPTDLTTPWTAQVTPTNALPDYPRPQLTRERWQNLNGTWQFAETAAGQPPPIGVDLGERVLVPYPVESRLSGIQRHVDRMWYRRTFTLPPSWRRDRLLLHFGAVDYQATVYVNGQKLLTHTGGYDPFSVDVTDALKNKGKGEQEIILGVTDTTDIGSQAVGKQRKPGDGIFYTPSSGIWQTVWMEPVATAHIENLQSTPDLAAGALRLTVKTAGGQTSGQTVEAVAYAGDTEVGRVTGAPGTELKLPVPKAHLWTPDDPFLYDLHVRLRDGNGNRVADEVGSYFGMRSITNAKGPDGKVRMMLNGTFVMQVGTLDQGFWPDGIYTAPTDAALRFDLEAHKKLGFNMVRKHIKVEPSRWYYWADRLGLLVWQDMPATFGGHTPSDAVKAQYETEMRAMMAQLHNHPSIVVWVPFNEGWGEYEPKRIADAVKSWDPSRLVDANSGVNCCDSLPDQGEGEIYDDHTYVGPGAPSASTTRAVVAGEYGGLGLRVDGHMYDPDHGFAYEMTPDSATLTRRYTELQDKMLTVEKRCAVSASVYTQITDVENEINGIYTYDRRVLKADAAAVKAANEKLIAASGTSSEPPTFPPGKPGLDGVSFYPFDEGSGTTAKDVAGPHDATLVNGPQWTTGHNAGGLQFNGSDQYADAGAAILDTTGNYSVSAWVKLDKLRSFGTAVSQDGTNNSAFYLQYSGPDDRFAFSFAGLRALSSSPPETGHWYHLTGVRDAVNGTLTLYVDGKQSGASAAACLGDPSTGHTVIGRGKYGGNPVDYWPGALDQVHLYDRALSAAEVSALYESGR